MLRAAYCPYRLDLNFEAVTSRGSMTHKDTYFVKVWDDNEPEIYGIGECALFKGLSADDTADYELRLQSVCRNILNVWDVESLGMSSIVFGLETALQDFSTGGIRRPWPGKWSMGESEITINGLVWMGSRALMLERIGQKLQSGFRCVKLKIGGIDFEDELSLLRHIRENFSSDVLELRLDANGAFRPAEALRRLDRLARYDIHSIEQPVMAGQLQAMEEICKESPIPVALDEELIGAWDWESQARLLDKAMPAYVILKPSLCGGFQAANRWKSLACERGIGWWATSAMESNVGLNSIAQWVSGFNPSMPQGLGTGGIYINNIPSPIRLEADRLTYDPAGEWEIPDLSWIE